MFLFYNLYFLEKLLICHCPKTVTTSMGETQRKLCGSTKKHAWRNPKLCFSKSNSPWPWTVCFLKPKCLRLRFDAWNPRCQQSCVRERTNETILIMTEYVELRPFPPNEWTQNWTQNLTIKTHLWTFRKHEAVMKTYSRGTGQKLTFPSRNVLTQQVHQRWPIGGFGCLECSSMNVSDAVDLVTQTSTYNCPANPQEIRCDCVFNTCDGNRSVFVAHAKTPTNSLQVDSGWNFQCDETGLDPADLTEEQAVRPQVCVRLVRTHLVSVSFRWRVELNVLLIRNDEIQNIRSRVPVSASVCFLSINHSITFSHWVFMPVTFRRAAGTHNHDGGVLLCRALVDHWSLVWMLEILGNETPMLESCPHFTNDSTLYEWSGH